MRTFIILIRFYDTLTDTKLEMAIFRIIFLVVLFEGLGSTLFHPYSKDRKGSGHLQSLKR